jgi:ketosteroid isomerase-like protein
MTSATDVVRGYLSAFAAGNPETIAAFVSEDFVNEHLSELGSGCRGRVEYLRRLPGFLETFLDRRYEIEDVVEDDSGEAVVTRYRFTATFEGIEIDIPGAMWFEVRNGLLLRRTDLWDSLTFLRQTGQAPLS